MIKHSSLVNWVGAAYDGGPLQVIEAITRVSACEILSLNSDESKSSDYWLSHFRENNIKGLICSTSQSSEGVKVEAEVRLGASKANIPIVCIEDFPGNYQEVDHAPTSLLIVESIFPSDISGSISHAIPPILIMPSVRYDGLRHGLFSWEVSAMPPPFQVLWAGQPESAYCIQSLEVIFPRLMKHSAKLLFRAHPRDSEYARGTYHQLFKQQGIDWVDVTGMPLDKLFSENIHLVITQFSSLAIEAGFYGIPALYLLLEEVGGGLLMQKNGYAMPAPVLNDAAFAIASVHDVENLDIALFDIGRRKEVMANFAHLYKVDAAQSPFLIRVIEGII